MPKGLLEVSAVQDPSGKRSPEFCLPRESSDTEWKADWHKGADSLPGLG